MLLKISVCISAGLSIFGPTSAVTCHMTSDTVTLSFQIKQQQQKQQQEHPTPQPNKQQQQQQQQQQQKQWFIDTDLCLQ